jgi:hypothetical protein
MGSIPDEVTRFFNSPIPPSCTVALGLTQPLTEMSTRSTRGSWCVKLTTSPAFVSQLSRKCGWHGIPQPYGPPQPVTWTALLACARARVCVYTYI